MMTSPRRRRVMSLVIAVIVIASLVLGVAGARASTHDDSRADVTALERAIEADGYSAAALVDLANAYLDAGEPGRAILALERARIIAPRDPSVAANLERARGIAGVSVTEASAVRRAARRLTADEWTWIALSGLTLACAGAVAVGWRRRRVGARLLVAGGFVGGLAAVGVALATPDGDAAIVVAPATARIAPFEGAEASFDAVAGESFELVRSHGGHVFVRRGDRAGWMRDTDVVAIVGK